MNHLFDPNAPAQQEAGIFNLPHNEQESNIILIPVPWEATCSGSGGTSDAPHSIFMASKDLDLGSYELDNPWAVGMHMLPQSRDIMEAGIAARELYLNNRNSDSVEVVNILCEQMNQHVEQSVLSVLELNKIPGLVGGDHSVALGAFRALDNLGVQFGILHVDAHLDMRDAYEGYKYSHASVMFNALNSVKSLDKIVSVGVRDFGPKEVEFLHGFGDRAKVHFDLDIAHRKISGDSFASVVSDIMSDLPDVVWVSLDIDGLDPSLCPHTGTPVPGGLNFNEILYIISELGKSGKKIIGFDLNEVAPNPDGEDDWDANVGMRVLYSLCSYAAYSQGMILENK